MDFIREIVAADVKDGKHVAPITRFPPEPNGYLHIGHAKAICLSFGLAQEYKEKGAACHLRFDDTNPAKEDQKFIDSIEEDIRWLGFQWDGETRYASNYFSWMHECALHLIEQGKAYVDEQSGEEIRRTRGNEREAGIESPYRDRLVEENLARFQAMKDGEIAEGAAVLRAKIDMAATNLNLRDPVLYRILHQPHHQTGEKWCIYPMYDFAHSLEDAFEQITHSLCSLEFEDHRPLYDWVVDECQPVIGKHVGKNSKPRQIEFARLALGYTVMSKRKLAQLVEENLVSGWDDPRMPTLAGMRRRGVPALAIRRFCEKVGMTKQVSLTDVALFEYTQREVLNETAPRYMAVFDPLKITITNWQADAPTELEGILNPEEENSATRVIPFGPEIWIEKDDFREQANRKFFRLKLGGEVRLRHGYILRCDEVIKDESGEIVELKCSIDWDTLGKNPQDRKVKGVIHWVSAAHAVKAPVRLYERLFAEERPDKAEGGFLTAINPSSLEQVSAYLEPALAAAAKPETSVQLERVGYFVADKNDSSPETPVLNRTVTLRDSWKG